MSSLPRLSTFEEYEAELNRWLERLKLVDELLERPAITLVEETKRAYDAAKGASGIDPSKFVIPTTLGRETGTPGTLFLRALCCSTVQRIAQRRRRFPWVKAESLEALGETLHAPFIALAKAAHDNAQELFKAFKDEPLRPASPLTAAEIFWVLIKAGEKYAHGAMGFFCIFNILWSLNGRREDHFSSYAPDPHDRPTAFVVAKCLLPIRVLCEILRHRARLYEEIADLVEKIEKHCHGDTQRDRWLMVSGLERLASSLHDFGHVATNASDYEAYSGRITAIADSFSIDSPGAVHSWRTVRGYLAYLLAESHRLNLRILKSATNFMSGLSPVANAKSAEEARSALQSLLEVPAVTWPADEWDERIAAFRQAYSCCEKSLALLQEGVALAKPFTGGTAAPDGDIFASVLRELAKVNERVAATIEDAVDRNTHDMRGVILREVASASAGDQTNFDASDLVAALATVERWLRISGLEVQDALKWSVAGAHADGSWTSRHPIAIDYASSTLWPGTSEIVWMLAMAVERKSRLRTADDALLAYANWLDRTKLDIRHPGDPALKISGWPSEARAPEVIDMGVTVAAVNALLSLRDLIEERLWELCEKRFVARRQKKRLFDIDPVDLGASHERRLHRRLMRMARDTSGSNYNAAEYSLVLHGPPGSSKTAVAEALAGDMWGTHRLIRITPADFTRQGEARLDSEARFVFDLLSHVRGVTVVFDEIDDLLRKRQQDTTMSFLRLVVPAMLNRLQDLRDAAPRQEICFVFSTNYIDAIEPALTRPGRFDATIPVPYPDAWSRENILQRNIEEDRREHPKRVVLIDRAQQPTLIRDTNAWPWSTFNKMCKELTTKPAGTAKDVVVQIDRHAAAVDDSISYYVRIDRWTDISRPLVQELLQSLFALYDLKLARQKLSEVVKLLPEKALTEIERKKNLEEQLEAAWHRDSRPELWEHRPGVPRRKVTGSGERMGATVTNDGTTFRVWAPFARQVAIISDQFADWKRQAEMQPLRDRPGVWELTVDNITLESLTRIPEGEARTKPAGQYRYVVMTGGGERVYKSDPYSREWLQATPRGVTVINSLILPERKARSRHPIDSGKQIVCRIFPGRLDHDSPFTQATTYLQRVRDLGFNCVEIAPTCDAADKRWGFDFTMPYGLESRLGGWSTIRDFVDAAHGLDLSVIMGSAWGFGGGGAGDPLWQYDGWFSQEYYKGGIYFGDKAGTCLDLDEPQVCNLIFDHSVECVRELGMDGIHLNFAQNVLLNERQAMMSLAHDLAQHLANENVSTWVDGPVNLSTLPPPCPCVCIEVDGILRLQPKDADDGIGWVKAFHDAPHTRAIAPGMLDDPQSIVRAVMAFTLPGIPVVTWSDRLLDNDAPAVRLLRKLIGYRTSADSPFTTTQVETLTNADDPPGVLNFLVGTAGREAVVLLNATDATKPFSFACQGRWMVDIDTTHLDAFNSSDAEFVSKEGLLDGHTNPLSAKVLLRDRRS
jgi:hypothetical protein